MFNKMTSLNILWSTIAVLFLPQVASAQDVVSIIDDVISVLVVIIPILLGLAVLVFFWGIVKFISHADDVKGNEDGKQIIFWGLITIFVMVTFWAILGWLQTELGLDAGGDLGTLPQQPGTIPTTF
jgi:fumarate reductase subunit D